MNAIKFPFGKFRGVAVDNIPSWYLTWALDHLADLDAALRADMQRVVRQRQAARTPTQRQRQHGGAR